MLNTTDSRTIVGGVVDGAFDRPDEWPTMPDGARITNFLLGDPISGPLVGFFDVPKGVDQYGPPHHHRSDSFRMALRNDLTVGRTTYRVGEYRVQAANQVYGPETFSPDGYAALLVVADRRGMPTIFADAELRQQMASRYAEFARKFMGNITAVHEHDDDATTGLTALPARAFPRGRLDGSIDDDAEWVQLPDGSRTTAYFLGDEMTGPVVVLTHHAPNSVEDTAAVAGTDSARLVLGGSVTIGERTFGPMEFRVAEAGADTATVIHGPDGSTDVLVFADRRAWSVPGDASRPRP